MSNDPEQEYFSDGITEDIITDLSRISSLFVVARNTAFTFKGLTLETLSEDKGPMYALFETEFGVRMVRAEEKIRAVLPDKGQRDLLQLPVNTPLLSVERIAYTYNDTPMELRRGFYRTDTHHYHNALN